MITMSPGEGTAIVATTVLLAVSMTETVFLLGFAV